MAFKELRKSKYPKLKDFCKEISENPSTVAMWESGKSVPKLEKITKIATTLNTTVDEVVAQFCDKQ
jgi:transcriptional regulator with XRE-family HTH domain